MLTHNLTHNPSTIIISQETGINAMLLINLQTLFHLPVLPSMSLLWSRLHLIVVSPISSYSLWQFLKLFCLLWLTLLKNTGQLFCRMSLNLGLIFSHSLGWDYVFWQEKQRSNTPFSVHHIKGHVMYTMLLILWLRWFLYHIIISFPLENNQYLVGRYFDIM